VTQHPLWFAAAMVLVAACAAPAPAPAPVLESVRGNPSGQTAARPDPAWDSLEEAELPPVEFQDEATRNRIARMEGYFPDPVLTTHLGQHVRFYSDLVRGKCVLIQFMYASCEGT